MRKILVSILALAMVLGFGGMAFAGAGTIAGAAFSDIAGHEAEGDLTLLAALGVFAGDGGVGGTVRPDATITRAEFCKVVVSATGKASTAAGLAGLKPTFADGASIPTWAWGYVNCATYMGVINGYADGTFRAGNLVTYGEAVTMLIRVVSGHSAQVPPGVWPYNCLFYGVDANFVGGVEVGFASLPCTRGDMARMLVATMQVDKLDKDGVAKPDTSILFPILTTGVVTTFVLGTDSTLSVAGVALPLAAKVYVVGASSYPGLLGLNVWAVENADGDVVAVLVKQATNTVKGVFSSYIDENTGIAGNDTYLLKDGTKIPISFDAVPAPTTKVTINGAAEALETLALLLANDECTFMLGADGKATNITALRFDLGKDYITVVTKSTATVDTSVTGNTVGTFDVAKTAAVSINSASIDRDALAKWDVIYLATKDGVTGYNATTNPIYAIRGARQGIEGTVKTVRTVTTAGGTVEYATFEFADKTTKEYVVIGGGNITPPLVVASTGKYGLDEKGKIFVQQSYAAGTTTVLVTEYITGTAGAFVTVDARGTGVTYQADVDFTSNVGDVGVIAISATTNHATGFTTYTPAGSTYDVVAVDAANGTLTLKVSGLTTYQFITDAVVYKYDTSDAVYTYVPLDQVGLWVSDTTGTIDHFINLDGTGPLVVYTVP